MNSSKITVAPLRQDTDTQDPLKIQSLDNGNGDITEQDTITNLTLHQGARFLDQASMMKLIQHLGKNKEKLINSHDNEKLSPLHYAAKSNCLDVVKLLVENGADVSNKGADEDTPMHYAARYRRQKKKLDVSPTVSDVLSTEDETHSVIEFLIPREKNSEGKVEANPNVPNKYGQSPLHFAAMRGNKIAVGSLLSRGDVNIEIEDKQGLTPLHAACIYNQTEIAQMLITAGVNLHCSTKEDSTPLHLACAEGNTSVVALLFANAGKDIDQMINAVDAVGYTCLHHAVDNNYFEITEMCIKKGANVNCRTLSELYPLHLAAAAGDTRVVKLLLEHHAKIDALDDDQATPLHKAAMYNHKDVVKELLSKKHHSETLIHKRDADGYTPFLLAAVYGHKETLRILYDFDSDVTSATEKNDKNALHLAAEENKSEALKFLLSKKEFGKEVLRTGDRYASEPLHLAAEKGCLEAVKVLLKHGADIGKNEEEETPLHLAAIHGWKEIVRAIVQKYPRSINDEDEDSNTPLHLASLNGQHETVDVLIDLEADVKCRNSIQWTPLDCAASKGWVKTARVLLENDAPVDAMDKASTTPLHLASQHGHVQMVNELLKAGAKVSHRNDKGDNSLDLAIEHNNKDCAIAIINSEQWQEALRNQNMHKHKLNTRTCRNYNFCDRDTPTRKLIRKMPDVAEMVFNKCMKLPRTGSQEGIGNSPYKIDYDSDDSFEVEFMYEFLDDAYSKWDETEETVSAYDANGDLLPNVKPYVEDGGTLKKNHCLNVMVKSKREELLAHPLVLSLLQYKWNHFVRYVYSINLIIYGVYLTFLTGYVVTTQPSYVKGNCTAAQMDNQKQTTFAAIGKFVIISLCTWHFLKELLQVYLSKISYIGMENLIELTVYICSFLLVFDFNDCQTDTGFRENWQWTVGAVAIFLAWVTLVLFIQKLPAFGIYVVMFTDILKTFIHFFVVFALFIIAFSLGFYVLLQNEEPFATVQESIIKTSVMMIGEFDYLDIFYPSTNSLKPPYEVVSYLLFITFTIIMSILIMNLLVGLAVDDIKSVQEKAELKRIAMQVDLALDVERIIPEFIRRKFIKRTIKMDLNAGLFTRLWKCMHLTGRTALTPDSVQEALNPELNDLKRIQKAQEKLQQKMEKGLQEVNNKIDSILEALKKT